MAYKITRGTVMKPVKACLYGVEGVGKTTFAAKWPDAVYIDIEDGSGHYDVARLPRPTEWLGLLAEVEAAAELPDIGTLVIDTADAAEALCISHVCIVKKWKGIEDPGFGKGYTYLAEEFGKLLKALDKVVAYGKNVLLLAHAQIRKFEQPDEMGAYDRWELKLQKKCAPLVKEWCDLLLFANYKTDLVKGEDKKTRASGGKSRRMYASHTAAFDAKNRLGLPDEMSFEFDAIADRVPGTAEERNVRGKRVLEMPADEAEAQAAAESLNVSGVEFEEATSPEVKQLHQLMKDSGVNEAMLRHVVGELDNNPYEDTTPIADYSEKFVGNLMKHWGQIAEKAQKVVDIYDDIPF